MKELKRDHNDDKERAIKEEREKLESFQLEKVYIYILAQMLCSKMKFLNHLKEILFLKTIYFGILDAAIFYIF